MPDNKPARQFIAEMKPNERFSGLFCIVNAQLAATRNGDPYLACLLSDKSGRVPARKWQMPPEEFKRLPTDGFVYAEGRTQPFKGELQLIVDIIDPAEPTSAELQDLLPTTKFDIGQMFAEVTQRLGTLSHPAMKALAEAYLSDEMLMDQFRTAPAAQMMHHAYLGGLLEHTLNLMRLSDVVCPLYPKISRDLVLMGLFLHDLGKTRELSYDAGFGYTDRGQLIGHIVDGAIMLHDKSQQVMREKAMRFPANAITILQHIILSHHGVPEFGAAKIPATPEALLVSMLDNLDAKMAIALDAARPDRAAGGGGGGESDLGGNFTEKQWALGSVRLFRGDPLGQV